MATIVRNDRGKVLARISKSGSYIKLSVVKRWTPVEAYRVSIELAAFAATNDDPKAWEPTQTVGAGTEESSGEKRPPSPPSGPSCEVCGKTFQDGRGMAGHARTHQDVA